MIANVFGAVMAIFYGVLGVMAIHDARKMRDWVFWIVPVMLFIVAGVMAYLVVAA